MYMDQLDPYMLIIYGLFQFIDDVTEQVALAGKTGVKSIEQMGKDADAILEELWQRKVESHTGSEDGYKEKLSLGFRNLDLDR